MSNEEASTRVSNAASNFVWFQKFMQIIHRCMGDVQLPNQAISQYEFFLCMNVLKLKWEEAQEMVIDQYVMKRTATTACVVLTGYFASLQGEEINCVDLGAMIKHWDKATRQQPMLTICIRNVQGRDKCQVFLSTICHPNRKWKKALTFSSQSCWIFVRAKGCPRTHCF